MQTATGDVSLRAQDVENAADCAVVHELVRLSGQVQNCVRLIERTIGDEAPACSLESSTHIIVLDDVTPRYIRAVAALQACDASLEDALRSLLGSDENARCPTRPAALSVRGA